MSLKNLIFDLGGVIIDLSIDHTIQAFSSISGMKQEEVNSLYTLSPGFEAYEKGLIGDNEFRDYVRVVYSINSSAEEIDGCWTAMLRGLSVKKLHLLLKLKEKYRVYLLSNTNSIHINYINQTMLPGILQPTSPLESYFHRAYYSHIMKKRKPNADIFEQVLAENALVPGETLFLDDNTDNLAGANQLGIKTVHVDSPNFILDYFNEQ